MADVPTKARLVAESGSHGVTPKEYYLTEMIDGQPCTIGRLSECCLLLIDYPGVSRLHARIFRSTPYFYLEDNESTHGTFLNGKRLQARQRLRNGDRIGFGSPLFMVRFEDATSLTDNTPNERLIYDPRAIQFVFDGRLLDLSLRETRLLAALYFCRPDICTTERCLRAIYGDEEAESKGRADLDQVVARLREVFRVTCLDRAYDIKSQRAAGYCLIAVVIGAESHG